MVIILADITGKCGNIGGTLKYIVFVVRHIEGMSFSTQ